MTYTITRKSRNTGQWWLPRRERMLRRKAVRRHFHHWAAKATSPERYPNGTGKVPHTPPVESLGQVFMEHVNSWNAGPTLTRPINVFA
jgi:hypothetical protein